MSQVVTIPKDQISLLFRLVQDAILLISNVVLAVAASRIKDQRKGDNLRAFEDTLIVGNGVKATLIVMIIVVSV